MKKWTVIISALLILVVAVTFVYAQDQDVKKVKKETAKVVKKASACEGCAMAATEKAACCAEKKEVKKEEKAACCSSKATVVKKEKK